MVDGWYAERESRNVGTGPAGGEVDLRISEPKKDNKVPPRGLASPAAPCAMREAASRKAHSPWDSNST